MKKIILSSLLLLSVVTTAFSQYTKQTFDFAIKGNDTLRLDKYEVLSDNDPLLKPCIIFAFGGGFIGGARDRERYLPFFEKMAEKGYIVISTDYRLGLKPVAEEVKKGVKIKATAFPKLLGDAVDTAVVDLYDATRFVINHAPCWELDTATIVVSGSSAGAITALQAEYYMCSNNELSKRLPKDFRYAGVISFAGAIFSTHGNLKWEKSPAPIQFFHGNADSNVPYDKIKLFNIGFFGSKNICAQLDKMKSPYYFYDINNAAHEIAEKPMTQNIAEIDIFLERFVKEKQNVKIHSEIDQIDKAEMKKKFGLGDYVKSNFTPHPHPQAATQAQH